MGKKQFCFFQTAETGNRTPDSGVKGSGANHYPRAPAHQADKLLKQLQNNPIKKSCQIQEIPKEHTFWLFHSFVIILVDALAQAYNLGSADQYQNVVVLFAVTFCGLAQDQWWQLRFDNMELNSEKLTTTRSTSLPHRER